MLKESCILLKSLVNSGYRNGFPRIYFNVKPSRIYLDPGTLDYSNKLSENIQNEEFKKNNIYNEVKIILSDPLFQKIQLDLIIELTNQVTMVNQEITLELNKKNKISNFVVICNDLQLLLNYFQKSINLFNDFPTIIVFEINESNCYEIDDFVLFCQKINKNNKNFSFIFSKESYCLKSATLSHDFSQEQLFHLSMFFEKLSKNRKLNSIQRLNYRQISQEFASDNLNLSKFFDQSFSVTLDLEQNMFLHFPRNKSIFQYPRKKILKVYQKKFSDNWNVFEEKSPINYFDPDSVQAGMIFNRAKEVIDLTLKHKISTFNQSKTPSLKIKPTIISSPKKWAKVLITGWYGTETTGDKAILAEVLHFIKKNSPDCEIIVTTINEKISQQTNRELEDLKNAGLVKIEHAHKPGLIESVDAVIFGGGPIMQSNAMQNIWQIFYEANKQQKARIIFGCGVGPIHTVEMTRLTSDVLKMSTAGFLRDQESKDLADQLAPDNNFSVACDPALAYLNRWYNQNKNKKTGNSHQIATLLRANTNEFIVDLDKEGLENSNQIIASKIAGILEPFCASQQLKAKLLAMNAPWIGGDDRLFNRLVGNSFSNPELVDIERAYYPLGAVIQSLFSSNIAIAMRYHGHLFCMALGIPFLSIDYTGKAGKVSSLLSRISYEGFSENWREFQSESALLKLSQIYTEQDYWSDKLIAQSNNLVEKLQFTYSEVFPEILT